MRHAQPIVLSTDDRQQLEQCVHRGKANVRTITRARVLLKSADGWSIAAITAALEVSPATVSNVRHHYQVGGLERVLHDKVQEHRRSVLSGLQAAHLIAVACTPAPAGHDHWTVRLLADKAVEFGYVEHIAPDTIHRLLKKTRSSRGARNIGACRKREANL